MQHTPSRFLKKVAGDGRSSGDVAHEELHHARPEFTRFMKAHPRISRFLAEHPKTSRFLFNVAHHIPVIERYVPIAPHISSAFVHQAKPHRAHRPRFF
jgi:hypothetical protein